MPIVARSFRVVGAVFILNVLLAHSLCWVAAQSEPILVELGTVIVTMTAGGENVAILPLSLSGGSQAEITKVQTEIVVPSKYLSFSRLIVKSQELRSEATTKQDPDDAEKSRLSVVISAVDSNHFIQPGLLVDLELKVSPYAPEEVIELPHHAEAYAASGRLDNVVGQSGFVTVSTPIIACFFYMH